MIGLFKLSGVSILKLYEYFWLLILWSMCTLLLKGYKMMPEETVFGVCLGAFTAAEWYYWWLELKK